MSSASSPDKTLAFADGGGFWLIRFSDGSLYEAGLSSVHAYPSREVAEDIVSALTDNEAFPPELKMAVEGPYVCAVSGAAS